MSKFDLKQVFFSMVIFCPSQARLSRQRKPWSRSGTSAPAPDCRRYRLEHWPKGPAAIYTA
jgi:hypothetical protein